VIPSPVLYSVGDQHGTDFLDVRLRKTPRLSARLSIVNVR